MEEFGDLTYWGHEFRKSVLLKHMQSLRLAAAARPHASPMDELGEQLALAVGALLISRVGVQGIGELVETFLRSGNDAVIAGMFEGYDAALTRMIERHPIG